VKGFDVICLFRTSNV